MATMKTQLPPPENWQDFEALCRELWSRLWEDPGAQMHGGRGQPQAGVDVFGRPGGGGEWAGVQCKLKNQLTGGQLTRAELRAEVKKAHRFNPSLSSFILATTAPRDAEIQEAAREITRRQLAAGSFPVTVASWEDIAQDLERFPDLKQQLYGHSSTPEAAARETYLRALWGKLLPLPLVGVGGIGKDAPLSAVYTSLDVTARLQASRKKRTPDLEHGGEGAPGLALKGEAWYLEQLCERLEAEAAAAREKRPRRRGQAPYSRRATALEAAAAAPRLVLLGPPGSGKSSFARYLALSLAGEALGREQANLSLLNDSGEQSPPEARSWPHGALLPLFVELKRLERSDAFRRSGEVGPEIITRFLSGEDRELARSLSSALAKPGGALVILDGLDETPSSAESRSRIKEAVAALAHAYPECRILVTSRPYAYSEGSPWRLEGLRFEDALLAPLDEGQAQAFIGAWYAFLKERGQCDAEQAKERSAGLWREISSARTSSPSPNGP